jgi:Aph-1 protein
MADILLVLGCALLAYGPFLSLFTLIVYQKAQLVIVVTTSAFFFLLAALFASLFWFVFDAIGLDGGGWAAIIPGVFFQFVFRCLFVELYHRVERVIQASLEKQHREEMEERQHSNNGSNGSGADHGSGDAPGTDDTVVLSRRPSHQSSSSGSNIHPQSRRLLTGRDKTSWTEAAKLRLQMNDASCGIAAGVGYGGMHAILLYGTLLTNQAVNNGGVLYQESCPGIPSLAVSAVYCFCFSVLDVFWMLFTFFGMRRRQLFHRGEAAEGQVLSVGGWLGDSRNGGNVALLLCLVTHYVTTFFTVANRWDYGCRVSLPAVGAMVLLTAYLFWAGVGRIFMPPPVPLSGSGSMSSASGAASVTSAASGGGGSQHPRGYGRAAAAGGGGSLRNRNVPDID